MRLRKVKNARERLMVDNNKYFINEPELYKGKWNELFGNNNPLHIEIGCGKGQFMSTLAKFYRKSKASLKHYSLKLTFSFPGIVSLLLLLSL